MFHELRSSLQGSLPEVLRGWKRRRRGRESKGEEEDRVFQEESQMLGRFSLWLHITFFQGAKNSAPYFSHR